MRRALRTLKKILPRGLFGRSLLIIVLPFVLLQGLMTFVFYQAHWDTVSRRLSLGVAGDLVTIIQVLQADVEPGVKSRLLTSARHNTSIDFVFEEGAILPNVPSLTTNRIVDRMLTRALGERLVYPFQVDTRSLQDLVRIKIQLADGVLTTTVPRKRIASSTTTVFVVWMVGASIILIGIGAVFLRNQMKPIRRLGRAAEAFGKGRPIPPIKPEGATEVRQATAAFLDMQERIQRQMQQRTEMLSGVSHDLRTPLTRMKLELAMMPASDVRENLESDIQQMERMIEEYLAFVRGEGGEAARRVGLDDIVKEVVEESRRQGARVQCTTTGDLMLEVRPSAMKRCLTNLVENAARFGSMIEVSARRLERTIELTVDDNGPGIPKDERENVFKPFVRLDHSRNPATGGAGLGLSIARDIVHAHGGEIALLESPRGGLRVRLTIPV
jgi:two-component system osmolarity sensor histidine kinase EnvZ